MKRFLLVGSAIIATMAACSLAGVFESCAQEQATGLWQQIQGNWSLVSIVTVEGGKKIDVYGTNPKGSMMITPDGRFSIIIVRRDLPKIAAKNKLKGTNEENRAIVQGAYAIFGKWSVLDEKEHTVSLTIEGSMYPNFDGEVQKRVMTVTGDEMKVTIAKSSMGTKNYLLWKRLK